MRRREILTLLGGAIAAWPLGVRAAAVAAAETPPKIGWLKIQGPGHSPDQLQAFREGMRALGLAEGRDFVLVERFANGHESRLPGLATELVGARVRVILATSQPSIAAAARVTRTVPVIGRMNDDPIANGMAKSLARPGGNITGIYTLAEEMNPKRLSLLKEAVPSLRRVGVLLRDDWPNAKPAWQSAQAAAQQLGLEIIPLNARTADELTAALDAASAKGIGGIITFRNPTVVTYLKLVAELCRKHRLPAVFDAREYVEAGGLMSYGPNIDAVYRQLASYAAKLLQGTPAADLPIEQPTTLETVINRRTAEAIGVSLPASVLERADEIIE
jgi:putative ABC transport system substrate-binding protein